MKMEFVQFIGHKSIYASFRIERNALPNGNSFEKLLIAHEGNWIDSDGMFCYPEYKFYEDVQKDLGKGLTFVKKEYSELLKRSLFLYNFECTSGEEYILSVPATGEEIKFEIYGMDQFGALALLIEREL